MTETAMGAVHVLPPGTPGVLPSVPYDINAEQGYVDGSCDATIPLEDVPDGVKMYQSVYPYASGIGVRYYCTRPGHDDVTPHVCSFRNRANGGAVVAHIVWGGE